MEMYSNFKNGDVIVFKVHSGDEIIAIFNKIEKDACGDYLDLYLYTYAELELFEDELITKYKVRGGFFYLVGIDVTAFRIATDDEKEKLYNAIGKHYTEEYDKGWYKHFTDSSYFEIRDFLLNEFCINEEEYGDDLLYPDFVNEIHKFIWNKLCIAMGVPNDDFEHEKSEMVNKSEFIAKVKQWLELETNWCQRFDENGRNENYGKIDELIKYLEE